MKKNPVRKKLTLKKETLAQLHLAKGAATNGTDPMDTDGDTYPSGGGMICWISDCNPCNTQHCTAAQ